MPNCSYYATPEDQRPILEWLFQEGSCEVYESHSEYEQPLRRFRAAEEVLAGFAGRWPNGQARSSVLLSLYVLGTGPFGTRRITLRPEACDGATFRYAAEGWGLVHLHLNFIRKGYLERSNTNHNSEARAQAWAPFYGMSAPDSWDFRKVSAFSSRLNRQIRRRAVAKRFGEVLLPGAYALWKDGTEFSPYLKDRNLVKPLESLNASRTPTKRRRT